MNPLSRYIPAFRKPEGLLRLQRNAQVQWQRLAPRERRLVTLAAFVAGAAFVWLVLFEPAWNTTSRLRAEMPSLRGQAAQLDAILAESQTLRQRAGSTGSAAPTLEAVAGSLARAGLQDHADLASAATGWQVSFAHAPVEPVLAWLRDMPAELRLEATQARLERPANAEGQAAIGMVSGTIQLARPEAAP